MGSTPHRKSQRARTQLPVCSKRKEKGRGRRRNAAMGNGSLGSSITKDAKTLFERSELAGQFLFIPNALREVWRIFKGFRPESFRILLRRYSGKREAKSLAPDGTPCTGITNGLLQRARITAGKLVSVGKETDRRWEQGEDPMHG